jgi:chaperonin GroEL|tara:strand:+ start:635 stop:2263 length:1629 start_codon:yes stop_codon:yes gene_type:complete
MNQMQMPSGFNPKDLSFGDKGRNKLISGITQIANAVKSTLGPRGNTVLIESAYVTGGLTVTKDGVTVAKAVDLVDPVENLAVRMMKQAADNTASSAGDGTTTAIVLTEALVKQGDLLMDDTTNRAEVLKEVVSETELVIEKLRKASKKITNKRLLDVAVISANNDKAIGKVIADTYKEVGKNGIVTVEKSESSKTYSESTNGVKIERGWTSPLFINNQKKDECVLDNVEILVSDAEISNVLAIENILKPIINEQKKLLIIAPMTVNVVNTLAANVVKNGLQICVIGPPQFGYKQHELMQDIAVSVGAKYFSEKTGDDLSLITYEDLGHADKCIIGKESSILIKSNNDGVDVSERVSQLWNAHEIATNKSDKEFILSRIASLSGGIGVIYVGGQTDIEQKELFDRVDDAVCAVRSAMLEGILPGGGVALYDIVESWKKLDSDKLSKSKKIADAILYNSLYSPLTQILENAGSTITEHYQPNKADGVGYDVKNEMYGEMIDMGIIDPMKVTKNALQNAVSVAVTILSTNAIITMARTYESNDSN